MPMTAHDLARELLSGPDVSVKVEVDGTFQWATGTTTIGLDDPGADDELRVLIVSED